MKKVSTCVLMLSLVLSAACCYAHGVARTEKEKDGTPIELIEKASHGGSERTDAILVTIDGHYLSVVFLENLGQVTVEVTRLSGGETQIESTPTPTGVNFYMSSNGSYMVTFTLSNGDEYYGEFEVTD